jgi:hypothetical protein
MTHFHRYSAKAVPSDANGTPDARRFLCRSCVCRGPLSRWEGSWRKMKQSMYSSAAESEL